MVPYSAGPFEFETQDDSEQCVLLKVPSRGFIRAIRLQQLSGVECAANFTVYTEETCCRGDSLASSESIAVADIVGDRTAYSVFGTKTRISGEPFEEYNVEYAYQNRDGGGPTNRKRRLYLVITPAVGGVKTWLFSLEIQMPTPV